MSLVGRQISHYRILERISEGAMGEVYKALDLSLDRMVAIKVLKATHHDAAEASRRFLREAQSIAKIDHPNVVTIHEIVQDGDVHYIVMQYVPGRSLRDRLRTGPLDPRDALRIASEVAGGLDAAHRLGVVHRDLKPENVMISEAGVSTILDFGVAHLIDRSTLTGRDRLVGTVPYLAPEQVQGGQADPRTDVHALGVMLFEMLAGQRPFEGQDDMAVLYAIAHREAPSLDTVREGLPPGLAHVVSQALSKAPERRYATAAAMLQDLEVLRGRLETPAGVRALRARRRLSHRLRWTGATVLLAAIAVLAVRLWQPAHARSPRVLVMRWEHARGGEQWAWLTTGIMDCMIRALGGKEGLQVVSRQTIAAAMQDMAISPAGFQKGQAAGAASRLGAAYLVTGSVEPDSQRVRVYCELTDVRRGIFLKSWMHELKDVEREFYPMIDFFAASVATELRNRVGSPPAPKETRRLSELLTPSMDALREYHRGLERLEVRDLPAAVTAFRAAVKHDSTFVEAHLALARNTPEQPERNRHLTQAMRFRYRARRTTRLMVEGEDFVRRNQLEQTRMRLEEVLAIDPEDVTARQSVATLAIMSRRFDDAAAEFAVLHEINPFDRSFYPDWADALEEIGRRDKVWSLLGEWRVSAPESEAPLQTAIAWHQRTGNYARALALCDTLEALRVGAARVYRATLFVDLARSNEARRIFEGLRTQPDPYRSASRVDTYLAILAYRNHEHSRGMTHIDRAISEQPEVYNHWVGGLLASAAHAWDRAEQHAEAIGQHLRGSDENATLEAYHYRRFYHHLKGMIALARGAPTVAVVELERALKHTGRGDSPYFRIDLARARLAANDADGAARELERVLEFNPVYPEARLELARVRLKQRDRARARAALDPLAALWKQAEQDDPLNRELLQLLAASH